jgi:hypothetical protein
MDSTRYMSEAYKPLQKIIYTVLVNKIDRVIDTEYAEYEKSMMKTLKQWCENKQRQFNLSRSI